MADAVLTQRLAVAVGGLALLFLTVGVLVGGFALLALAVDRYRRTDAQQDEFLAETVDEPVQTAVAWDTKPGVRLDWHDECELIASMGVYEGPDLDAGLKRLRQAIRDQQNGEQT